MFAFLDLHKKISSIYIEIKMGSKIYDFNSNKDQSEAMITAHEGFLYSEVRQ